MKTKNENIVETDVPVTDVPAVDVKIVLGPATDQDYLVDNGVKSELLKSDGFGYSLPKNAANRQWISIKKIEAARAAGEKEIRLFYKTHRQPGSMTTHIPNEKLIAYLSEDLQAEYRAIVERAYAAREAAKAKPMTELEKAKARLEKARKALEKLEAEATLSEFVENN